MRANYEKILHFLCYVLTCALVAPILFPCASAANTDLQVYKYSFDNLSVTVSYSASKDVVVETTTFSDTQNHASITKKVSMDGTIDVYLDNTYTVSYAGGDYGAYLNAAMGRLEVISNSARAYDCGYSATHMYVDVRTSTVEVAREDMTVSILATLLSGLLSPAVGVGVGVAVSIAQYALNCGADYVEFTEYKYYVHDADLMRDMNCFHTLVAYYSYMSSGAVDIYTQDWIYYQYLL